MSKQVTSLPFAVPLSDLRAELPGALDHLTVLTLEGRDAIAFAQAQLASDVGSLAEMHWQWTCLLSAQGRVLGFGPLMHVRRECLYWIVPTQQAASLCIGLRRFVLRRKLRIEPMTLALEGSADPALACMPPRAGGVLELDGAAFRVALGGVAGRVLRLGGSPTASSSSAGSWVWGALDAIDGLPQLVDAAVENFTAHALGLQRLAAFSTHKGCYPGQEIVARTHFLGRNKREPRWAWLPAGSTPPGAGERWSADGATGETFAETVHAAPTRHGTAVLVVARQDAPSRLRCGATGAVADFHVLSGPIDPVPTLR